MSDVTRYFTTGTLLSCQATRKLYSHATDYVRASDYDAAQSQLAALREELAKTKQRVARLEIASASEFESVQLLDNENSVLKQRLADAERRNAELIGLLRSVWECSEIKGDEHKRIAFYLNPKPEAASHDK